MIKSEDVFYEKDELNKMMKPFLTENRVRGVMYYGKMDDFIDDIKLAQYQSLASHKVRALIYGVGASYIHKGDTLIYYDLARWEIQLRYRKGMPNFKQDNDDEDVLKKIKRGFYDAGSGISAESSGDLQCCGAEKKTGAELPGGHG